MTICFLGNYIKDYPRIEVIRKGLQKNGVRILECHTRQRGIKKYLDLYQQHKKIKNKYDILMVMMSGQTLVWFAKLISNKKIIFDAFASLYLTNVKDRQTCSEKSLHAKYYAWLDKISVQLANKVLLDTQAQINFYVKKYKLNKNKFVRLFVGCDNLIFKPQYQINSSEKFIVHWHGYIVPFYSVETIILAADLLKNKTDIEFHLITRFNTKYDKIQKLIKKLNLINVSFFPETKRHKLNLFINKAQICLGIFGNNKKAQVVIPNKIYEAMACAKPIITANQPAVHELFTNQQNILLCQPNNPQDLADKILILKNNFELQKKIGGYTYDLFKQKLTPEILGKELLKICQTL